MSAKERLQAVQAALEARGVRDVKFCFAKGVKEHPSTEVVAKVATFLETYAAGKCVPLTSIDGVQFA